MNDKSLQSYADAINLILEGSMHTQHLTLRSDEDRLLTETRNTIASFLHDAHYMINSLDFLEDSMGENNPARSLEISEIKSIRQGLLAYEDAMTELRDDIDCYLATKNEG